MKNTMIGLTLAFSLLTTAMAVDDETARKTPETLMSRTLGVEYPTPAPKGIPLVPVGEATEVCNLNAKFREQKPVVEKQESAVESVRALPPLFTIEEEEEHSDSDRPHTPSCVSQSAELVFTTLWTKEQYIQFYRNSGKKAVRVRTAEGVLLIKYHDDESVETILLGKANK